MSVIEYYNEQARDYDQSRFSNSYGKYIDLAERSILDDWLKNIDKQTVIDFGCGTGRFLDYAMTGMDASGNMLEIAASKYPDRSLVEADISCIPSDITGFDAAICFHVMMHLEYSKIQLFFCNASAVIRPGGKLIVDFLSAPRRNLLKRGMAGWHGNTEFTISEIAAIVQQHWKVTRWRGILMIPIHRLPSFFRPFLLKVDMALCSSMLAPYASYYIVEFEHAS
jgi:ubiquinone/menaquinone biosynthesis C-methylase UbiE